MAAMFNDLSEAVGPGMPNRKEDVKLVQQWLSRWSRNPWISYLGENAFDAQTRLALENFQRRVMRQTMPSGVVRPRDTTAKRLSNPPGVYPGNRPLFLPLRTDFRSLTEEDYREAALELDCEVRAIKAVAKTESRGAAFDFRQRPTILFEPAKFHLYSGYHFVRSHPNLQLVNKHYGGPEQQWKRLEEAYGLDAQAAILATSWGKFQTMGFNYFQAGFAMLEVFLTAMCASEKAQLDAFVAFIKYSKERLKGLQKKNWAEFAKYYNGDNYRENNYDVVMRNNYDKLGH